MGHAAARNSAKLVVDTSAERHAWNESHLSLSSKSCASTTSEAHDASLGKLFEMEFFCSDVGQWLCGEVGATSPDLLSLWRLHRASLTCARAFCLLLSSHLMHWLKHDV